MGRVFIYRELYVNLLHPTELAAKILEMSPSEEKYEYMCASPDIWGKKSDMKDGGETIKDGLQKALSERITMTKAMNARVEGWLKLKEWLMPANDGRPWLQVSPDCENLIRTIPGAIYEARPGRNNEDMDIRCEDHAMESMRYGAVSLMNVPRGTMNPNLNGYERIFGKKNDLPSNHAFIPQTGRGGY